MSRSWHDDIADYTHNLTASELKLFQYGLLLLLSYSCIVSSHLNLSVGYAAARELLSWRSGHSNILQAATVLGKHSTSDQGDPEASMKRSRI
jgi:hypothetical protein